MTSNLRLELVLISDAKTIGFVNRRWGGRSVPNNRFCVFRWEREDIFHLDLQLGPGILGGSVVADRSFFELLSFILELVKQFDLTVFDTHQTLPDNLRVDLLWLLGHGYKQPTIIDQLNSSF